MPACVRQLHVTSDAQKRHSPPVAVGEDLAGIAREDVRLEVYLEPLSKKFLKFFHFHAVRSIETTDVYPSIICRAFSTLRRKRLNA